MSSILGQISGLKVILSYIIFTWNIYVCPQCPFQAEQVAVPHFLVIPGVENYYEL